MVTSAISTRPGALLGDPAYCLVQPRMARQARACKRKRVRALQQVLGGRTQSWGGLCLVLGVGCGALGCCSPRSAEVLGVIGVCGRGGGFWN